MNIYKIYNRTSSGNSTISNVADRSAESPKDNDMTTTLEIKMADRRNLFSIMRSMNGGP